MRSRNPVQPRSLRNPPTPRLRSRGDAKANRWWLATRRPRLRVLAAVHQNHGLAEGRNFDHLPPLFAAAALESAAIKDRAFLDAAIAARGAKLGKPTVGLDTVDHDALIFSSLHCVVNKIELDLDDLDLVHKNTLGEIAAYA